MRFVRRVVSQHRLEHPDVLIDTSPTHECLSVLSFRDSLAHQVLLAGDRAYRSGPVRHPTAAQIQHCQPTTTSYSTRRWDIACFGLSPPGSLMPENDRN